MNYPTFIGRRNGVTLWSYGNYQYQLEWKSGKRHNFENSFEAAYAMFDTYSH